MQPTITLDPQWITALVTAGVTLIGALIAVGILLLRAMGNLKAAQVNFETAKVETATARVKNQRDLDQHKAEIEALKLANEAAELRRKADLVQQDAAYAAKLRELNEKQQGDIHTLALQLAELRGQLSNQTRVQDNLEKRLQAVSEQKIEIAAQANALQSELELARAAEVETAAALSKANQLNQSYEKRLNDAEANAHNLQDKVNGLTVQVATLQTQIDSMKQAEVQRHSQWSDISAQNLRYAALLVKYQLALQAITAAIPVRDLPPGVVSGLTVRGIDLTYLLNLHYDTPVPAGPVIQEPPVEHGDTPSVPMKVVEP